MDFRKIPYRTNFRRTKFSAPIRNFGGQNIRQQAKFSALFSAEILSDKVPPPPTTIRHIFGLPEQPDKE